MPESDRKIVSPTGIGTRKRVPKKPRAKTEEQESAQQPGQQPEMRQRPAQTPSPISPLTRRKKTKSGGAKIARRMAGAITFVGLLLSGGGDSASAAVMEATKCLF